MIRRWSPVLIVALMTTGILSDSGRGQEVVNLRWATWSSAERVITDRQVIEAFQRKFPNIKVKLEVYPGSSNFFDKMNLLIAGGDTPDVAYHFSEWLSDWDRLGIFEDLRPYIARDPDKSVFEREALGTQLFTTRDGAQRAMPWIVTSLMVYYNVDLFKKNGVPFPQSTWTWSQFEDIAKKFVKEDQYGALITTTEWDYMIRWIWVPFGGYYVDQNITRCGFDQPGAIAGLGFYERLYQEKVTPPYSYLQSLGDRILWQSGRVAMLVHQQAGILLFMDGAPFEWQIQEIPIATSGKRITRGAAAGNGILAKSAHKTEAWQFLKFISVGDGARILAQDGRGSANRRVLAETVRRIPFSRSLHLSPRSFNSQSQRIYVNSLAYAQPVPTPPNNGQIEKAFAPYWDELRLGTRPASAIAQDMQRACTTLLKK